MNSSPDARAGVLRGFPEMLVRPARIDASLRDNPYLRHHRADPRLVDPALAEAFEEAAAEVREDARREGFAAGRAEGLAAGRADAESDQAAQRDRLAAEAAGGREALAGALQALQDAARAFDGTAPVQPEDLADVVARAAFTLATTLLGRDLELTANPGLDAVRRALAAVPDGGEVTVHLNPADAELLGGLASGGGRAAAVRVVADPSVARGDAVADCGLTRVDARLSAAVERARKVILG